MKNSSFYFKWWPFILGFLIGILGVLLTVLSVEDRRDKIYSALFGMAINMVLTFVLLKNGYLQLPVMK